MHGRTSLIILHLLFAKIIAENCAKFEHCLEDVKIVDAAAENFLLTNTQRISILEEFVKGSVDMKQMQLNKDVEKGPDECKQFYLDPEVNHQQDVVDSCGVLSFIGDPSMNEVESAIASFPADYITNNTRLEREYYCKYLVKFANFFCTRIAYNLDIIEQCDVSGKFYDIFKKPWLDCTAGIKQS